LRIEIIRPNSKNPDKDEIITWLWEALNPLFKKTNGKIMAFMSNDLGEKENQRGIVIVIKGLKTSEIEIRKMIERNPSSRKYQEEI